jgi:RES domain-containing protein
MKVYRLAKERVGKYRADDLSGNGAALIGGRWNPKGSPVIYCCLNASTAVLEMRVHASGMLPLSNLFLVTLDVPSAAIDTAFQPTLPADWNAVDRDPASTVALARNWLARGKELAMLVPSVVCPDDRNLILNVRHPAMLQVGVIEKKLFEVDRRLFR